MKYIKHTFNSFSRKRLFILVVLFFVTGYSLVVFAVAPVGGYTPGQTLDPDCAAYDADCVVTIPTLTFDAPLVNTSGTISLPAASTGIDGYLSASDWNAFNNKENGLGTGTSGQYLRGDKTFATLNTTVVPEGTNLYWTNNRFDTRIASVTSIPNLQTIGTITSGVWHGSQITDAYISDSITASNYIPLSQKGAPNGVATLDGGGKITASQLSSFSLSDTFVVNSEAEMLALSTAELGDVAIRLDINKSYILTTNDPADLNNWQEIITPLNHVIAVNGQTGAVNLTTTDINEGLNLYYTDSRVDDYLNTQKGVANGIASLDANGHIPTSQIGSIVLNETFVVLNQAAMLGISGAHNGDLAVITSTNETYVLADESYPTNISSWIQIVNGVPISSVNGQTGVVNLTTTNISEGSNQYFTNTRARNALTATGPLTYNAMTGVFGITSANATTNGYLSAVDWSLFASKQDALTFGNFEASQNPEITITGGTGAVIGGGINIVIPDASESVRGLVTNGYQVIDGDKIFLRNVGIRDTSPSEAFSVGDGGLFQVTRDGDLVKINNVSYSWTPTQGDPGTILTNDGSGNLTWGTNGMVSLNGASDAEQFFATSTSGSDFSIDTLNGVHTFNFPTASASARGLLSSATYTEFNNKPFVDTIDNNVLTKSLSVGNSLVSGSAINNIIFGYQAGDVMTTGNNNTLLGYQAGKNITSGVVHSFFAGSQAGLSALSANNSIFIGRQAGSGASGASFASFLGRSAGINASGAQYGVFIGDNAGNTASGSNNAIFIGQQAGSGATAAPYSTFIGTSAGLGATGATTATFIGYAAGYTALDADYATFVGRGAGFAAANAQYSNFIGYQSGYNANNAANSIFIGKNAGNGDLVNNIASGSSIAIGDGAGTGGNSNSIALGASAINTLPNQLLIGSSYTNFNVRGINYVWPSTQAGGAGYALVNNGSGTLSWSSVASVGGSNGEIQYNNNGSLGGIPAITYNGANFDVLDTVFRIGDNVDTTKRAIFELSGIDSGTTRTYTFPNGAGTFALATGLLGGQTIYGGTASGDNLTLGSTSNGTKGKILFGTSAYDEVNNRLGIGITSSTAVLHLKAGTAAASTAPLKFTSGTNLTTAEAGVFEYDGSSLLFTPSGTLRSGILMTDNTNYNTYTPFLKGATAFTTGARNTLIGYQAGNALTTGNSNAFIGYQAGFGGSGMSDNNAIGYQAGYNATTAASSNFIGYQAGTGASGVYAVNFIGMNAGASVTSANYANFIGYSAGYGASLASQANFIGFSTGYGSHSAQYSNFMGSNAGSNAPSAANSNFFGQNAGNGATNASNSNFFGNATGFQATNANDSIFMGQNAGRNATGATESIFMGKNAGYNATSTGITGDYNLGLGTGTAMALTTGSYNTLLGYQVGDTLTTGSKNIAIGYNIDLPSNTTDGQMTLGNLLFGTGIDGTGTTLSTGKVGIGVASPSQRLDVVGAAADTTVMRIATTSGNACTFSTTTGVFSCASDSRLKHDISPIDSVDAITKLGQLNPVTYRYNWQNQNESLIAGFVAQEFETVFPELVTTDPATGYKSLSYAPLMPYAIKAIQEMNLKVTTINNMDTPNTWRDSLIAWFANTANGITEFFSKKVSTEELCVKDSAGQTCITRSQLDALLNAQSIQTPPPQNSTPPPDPITCTAPEVLNSDGTACETPASEEPPSEPEPVPPTE